MRIIMVSQITGFRADGDGNYTEWPGRGEAVDVGDNGIDAPTAAGMLRSGQAVPESGSVEDAIRALDIEDVTGIPVSLDSVPGPIDETAPVGIKVPKPNGELREISSTKRLEASDHDTDDPHTVDETSGPVIFPDQSSPSGPDITANEDSGLKPARKGASNKTGQGNVPVAKAGSGNTAAATPTTPASKSISK